ncbi:hypothetical protein LEP1GSC051_1754 [Leptospira sp. P2653]|nr:hypothetical protein LEP1GSC051_1754 [Leptospira sp. P2653]
MSLISAEHKVPPFGAEIRLAALDEIITDFLRSKYLAGIPLSEFSIADPESETREPFDLILKVYYPYQTRYYVKRTILNLRRTR